MIYQSTDQERLDNLFFKIARLETTVNSESYIERIPFSSTILKTLSRKCHSRTRIWIDRYTLVINQTTSLDRSVVSKRMFQRFFVRFEIYLNNLVTTWSLNVTYMNLQKDRIGLFVHLNNHVITWWGQRFPLNLKIRVTQSESKRIHHIRTLVESIGSVYHAHIQEIDRLDVMRVVERHRKLTTWIVHAENCFRNATPLVHPAWTLLVCRRTCREINEITPPFTNTSTKGTFVVAMASTSALWESESDTVTRSRPFLHRLRNCLLRVPRHRCVSQHHAPSIFDMFSNISAFRLILKIASKMLGKQSALLESDKEVRRFRSPHGSVDILTDYSDFLIRLEWKEGVWNFQKHHACFAALNDSYDFYVFRPKKFF